MIEAESHGILGGITGGNVAKPEPWLLGINIVL